ncbi:MAG: hypothetical protein P8Y70_18830 [Candidatus Lokiarchaeota archaeon]
MEKEVKDKESLIKVVREAIELLCEKNLSDVVILSSYKINSVLKENYGVDIRADKVGRILSNVAKRNQLKRLKTGIPKYKLHTSKLSTLNFSV